MEALSATDRGLNAIGNIVQEFEYKGAVKNLGKKCETVLRSVPEWFGIEDSLLKYAKEIDNLDTYTAWFNNELIGFISVKHHNKYSAELYVLGIKLNFHRNGIGTKLYSMIEQALKEKNVKYVQVKTLSSKANDVNYEKTRLFYLSLGFVPLEEFSEFWTKDSPCLQMIKSI